MTKCIVIGKQQKETKKKPIEITHQICASGYATTDTVVSEYEAIELICYNYTDGKDLMFAYDEDEHRGKGSLFLGHWNDGVVE